MIPFPAINYLAVLSCAILLWILGAVWYSPALFAKKWMELIGVTREPGKRDGLLLGMTASFFGDLVMSFIIANILVWANISGFQRGAVLGVLLWIGFIAAPNLPQGLYEKRPFKLFAINSGYWLVGLLIVGGILASWHATR
ncbi:MAG: DUF1761 domain-containing protein [Acidobacteria bacterium]|nr:DUF1761 domain-containing protein [Acidobacteriota bacterium]